jgi:undecaprenyl phosphate-alpha-L-ara4N flippase subunit ArnE
LSALAILLCILCQLLLVGGHLLLKHAINGVEKVGVRSLRVAGNFAGGIGLLSLWLFLWLGLLHDWELSHLFPFEGLNPALLLIGAAVFLRERVPLSGWIGVGLISAGVALVSGS